MTLRLLSLSALFCSGMLSFAQEKADLVVANQIRTEAFQNSKVMDHLFYLTDVHGPRVTNSPGYLAAASWAQQRLQSYGLQNAKQEKWGPFGQGWTFTKFSGHLLAPQYAPLIGFPLAWSPGTNGPLQGEPMLAVLRTQADLDKWKGKLKGKIVLVDEPRETPLRMESQGRRLSETDLAATAEAPDPGAAPLGPGGPNRAGAPMNIAQLRQFRTRRIEFLKNEGIALVISAGNLGDGGTVFATQGGSRDPKDAVPPPMVAITPEHYNRMIRLLEHKIPVKVEFEIEAKMLPENKDSLNVLAEIPGSKKAGEVVMIGAHLDSWQGGTGATDNAAGCAVVMEAMRILKALDLKPQRTIRVALWGGEEEGLLGSKAYVKEHFGDPETMKITAEHAKLAGYFNLDNGTGKIRGIYLQSNGMMRPIAEAWLAPFQDLGAKTVSIRNTGGTDHLSFDAVGIPGFQFIQDPIEYTTRTHHSNMDTYDRVQRGDLMQAAAIMASFAYQAAMRDEPLPRKSLPKPAPAPNPAEEQMPRSSAAPATGN